MLRKLSSSAAPLELLDELDELEELEELEVLDKPDDELVDDEDDDDVANPEELDEVELVDELFEELLLELLEDAVLAGGSDLEESRHAATIARQAARHRVLSHLNKAERFASALADLKILFIK